MQKIRCCYKCEERHVGCHSECERYISELKENDLKRMDHMDEVKKDAHLYDSIARIRKRSKRSKR